MLTQRIQNGVNGLIYQKVMRKSVQRDTTFSLGEITNITQDDSGKISNISSAVNRILLLLWKFSREASGSTTSWEDGRFSSGAS